MDQKSTLVPSKREKSNISFQATSQTTTLMATNTLTYTGANGTDPGNVTFSLVNAKLGMKHFKSVILTILVMKVKTNKTFKLLFLMQQLIKQLTIKLIQGSSTQVNYTNLLEMGNRSCKATHKTGLAGTTIYNSNNRDILVYKHVASTTDSTQKHLVSLVRVLSVKTGRTSRWSQPLLCETYF